MLGSLLDDPFRLLRATVSILVLFLALYYAVVAFDNMTNPASNWAFVQGVMTLDGVPPDSGFEWRAVDNVVLQKAAYVAIIAGETLAAALLAIGGLGGLRRTADAAAWRTGQRSAILGLLLVLAVFFVGFIVIGGNWWVMYLNKKFNGLDPAFQNCAVALFVLLAIMGALGIDRASAGD